MLRRPPRSTRTYTLFLYPTLCRAGLWVRLKIGETPDFARAVATEAPVAVPLGELFRHHLVATLAGTFAVVACFAIFYLATSFALAHGTTALGYPKEQDRKSTRLNSSH